MGIPQTAARLARRLRERARFRSEEVETYLTSHEAEWRQIAHEAPPDAADIVEEVDEDTARSLIATLEREDAAEVLDETRTDVTAELIAQLPVEHAAGLVRRMTTQKATDVLGALPAEARRAIVARLPAKSAQELAALLDYPTDSAGGMMSTRIATFSADARVREVIEQLRRQQDTLEERDTLFVVDEEGRLTGTFCSRELLFADAEAALSALMKGDPERVTVDADRERAAELALRYDLQSVPVVDAAGRLLGVVTRGAVLETVQAEASEDFAVASGAGAEETVFTRVLRSVRMRLPWLLGNLVMALAVVFAVDSQKGIIARNAALAALMPLVAQVGGNGGAQALAVVIRGMATDVVSAQRVFQILVRQLTIGLVNGALVALAAAGLGTFVGGLRVGIVVGLAALANVTLGSLAGAGIPILLKKLGLDPALASNIFLTLLTDLVGFGGFLLIATLML